MTDISPTTIERLPLYKKTMEDFRAAGKTHVSSTEIAERLHLSDAQIRKDLSYFGKFGVRGKGYDIARLIEAITQILGTLKTCPCVLVGVGNLGQALLSYEGFRDHNFVIEAAFDVDPDVVGSEVEGCPVHPVDELGSYLDESDIELAILAVPAEAGPRVLDTLIEHGIRGVLNFAPFVPEESEDVMVKSVDLSTNLEILACFTNNAENLGNAVP